jgi:hypothetical protein
LNERITPIIALDAKKRSKINPKDNIPILEPLKKKSTKFINPALYVFAGTMSIIKLCNCICILFLGMNGRLGISVNKNKQVGGMDMIKLKEMAEALSVKPDIRNCFLKNLTTS